MFKKSIAYWSIVPVLGACLFLILYVIAAGLYPGGSDAEPTSKEFSMLHNYWCELLAKQSHNGIPNPSRPIAITAMFLLGVSQVVFWWFASRLYKPHSTFRILILATGTISASIMIFLFMGPHDLLINLSALFAIIAMTITLAGFYNQGRYELLGFGFFCFLLCILNNFIYHTGHLLYYLPIVQKITFLFFLGWFCAASLEFSKSGE